MGQGWVGAERRQMANDGKADDAHDGTTVRLLSLLDYKLIPYSWIFHQNYAFYVYRITQVDFNTSFPGFLSNLRSVVLKI